MRVAQFSEFGGPDKLRIGEGDVVIRISSVGLNFFDTLVLRNKYQISPPLPFSPGAEVAGTIESLGSRVSSLEIGQG